MRLLSGFTPSDCEAAGDTMPYYWNGKWHIFCLKSPPGTWGYPDRVRGALGHIVSRDLVDWTELPDCLTPGAAGAYDCDGVWTGSVLERNGTFHFYYTGFNTRSATRQTICHATSTDLVNWTKDPANPIIKADTRYFEPHDWRDPFLFKDPDTGGYAMLIAARVKEGPSFCRGCIAIAYSDDLQNWELKQGPHFQQRLTHCPECPELFQLGDWWYLVYSRYSEHSQTIYRASRSPHGPWEARALDSLEGRRFYAAKSAADETGRRVTFAWTSARTRYGKDAPWEWGGTFAAPRDVIALEDGTLITRLVPEVAAACRQDLDWRLAPGIGEWSAKPAPACDATGTFCFAMLPCARKGHMLLEATLEIAPGTNQAGLLIEPDAGLASGYLLALEPLKGHVILDRWPSAMDPNWQGMASDAFVAPELDNPLVSRPLAFMPPGGRFQIRVLRTDTLLECFIADQVAATYRIYETSDVAFGLFVREGQARFNGLSIRSL